MTTVYTVLHVDRHSDPSVQVFSNVGDAVRYAKTVAIRHANSADDLIEKTYAPPHYSTKWVYSVTYSCENDHLVVAKAEVHP